MAPGLRTMTNGLTILNLALPGPDTVIPASSQMRAAEDSFAAARDAVATVDGRYAKRAKSALDKLYRLCAGARFSLDREPAVSTVPHILKTLPSAATKQLGTAVEAVSKL